MLTATLGLIASVNAMESDSYAQNSSSSGLSSKEQYVANAVSSSGSSGSSSETTSTGALANKAMGAMDTPAGGMDTPASSMDTQAGGMDMAVGGMDTPAGSVDMATGGMDTPESGAYGSSGYNTNSYNPHDILKSFSAAGSSGGAGAYAGDSNFYEDARREINRFSSANPLEEEAIVGRNHSHEVTNADTDGVANDAYANKSSKSRLLPENGLGTHFSDDKGSYSISSSGSYSSAANGMMDRAPKTHDEILDAAIKKAQKATLDYNSVFGNNFVNALPFNITTSADDGYVEFHIAIQGRSYLYKSSISFEADSGFRFILPRLPKGEEHTDALGTSEVYFKELTIRIPVITASKGDSITMHYQGCDEAGLCYPPQLYTAIMERDISGIPDSERAILEKDANQDVAGDHNLINTDDAPLSFDDINILDETSASENSIRLTLENNLLLGLLICFLLGIGLDLTPCVLPMLPIFSAMIVGSQKKSIKEKSEFISDVSIAAAAAGDSSEGIAKDTAGADAATGAGAVASKDSKNRHKLKDAIASKRWRVLLVQNLAYALGLSVTYMILGLLFSLVGASIHGVLQSPAVTITMAVLLLVCALACADVIEFKVPDFITNRLRAKMSRLNTKSAPGAFMLGAISALIASPCTSAPLAGALLYVLNNGDLFTGAITFFVIGLGMATPLFFIGVFGSKILQKSGIVGDIIKRLLVIVLLITAYYLVHHLLGRLELITVSLLSYIITIYVVVSIIFFIRRQSLSITPMTFVALLALVPTYFAYSYFDQKPRNNYEYFTPVYNQKELSQLIDGNYSFVVFTASWCANCKVMEEEIYSTDKFASLSHDFKRVVIDITDVKNPAIAKILNEYKIIGVPYYMAIDANGKIVRKQLGLVNFPNVIQALNELKRVSQEQDAKDRLRKINHI